MNSKVRVLQRVRDDGKAAALSLACKAPDIDGTAIIAEEDHIPVWSEHAVYRAEHVGYPIQDDGQVYTILMAHTPAHNPGQRPADLRSIYSLLHTKDPERAKSWRAPAGTSGLYMLDEVCTYPNQEDVLHLWRCLSDNNCYPPLFQNAETSWADLGVADCYI